MRPLATRAELPALLVELGLTGAGVEVGVQEGAHAAHLLRNWPGVLFAVDPWRADEGADYVDIANVTQDEQDRRHLVTVRNLFEWSKIARCHVWRMAGADAASFFPMRSLDLVYLDARHDYASVIADLAAWTPLVKPSGILAGHDYLDGEITFEGFDRPTVFGVKRAVDEWARLMGWALTVTTEEQFPTWYVEVP